MHKASELSWSVLSLVILDNVMFFIGIDVSKAKLDCSLLLDAANSKRRAKSVANSKIGISELLSWCAKQQVNVHELHAILEGTGVYHEQAALALTDAGATVSIVNPAQVKDFGRSLGVRTKTMVSIVWYWPFWRHAQAQALDATRPGSRVLQALLSRREALLRTCSASAIVWKKPMPPTRPH